MTSGKYIKNLDILGRNLDKTLIIDNSLEAFGFQPDHGILISSWFSDREDRELARILEALMELKDSGGEKKVPEFLRRKMEDSAKEINNSSSSSSSNVPVEDGGTVIQGL